MMNSNIIELEKSIINYKKENKKRLYTNILSQVIFNKYFVYLNDEGNKNTPKLITDKEGKKWLPIYTSDKYINEENKTNNIVIYEFLKIFDMIMPRKISGLVINPLKESEIYINTNDFYVILFFYKNRMANKY